jgi:uncharacterized protein
MPRAASLRTASEGHRGAQHSISVPRHKHVWRIGPFACTVLWGILVWAAAVHGEGLTADTIMEKNFVATKYRGSTAHVTFTLINKSGQERVRETLSTSKLQANARDSLRLVRFLSPPDIAGTATLLIEHADGDDDIWIYLPALKKVRRLVAANKKDSFVGTDLSYGDIIGHKVQEWTHVLIKEDTLDEQACYVVESTPNSDATREQSGYSKRLSWLRTDNFVLVRGEFWDANGTPLKTFVVRDVRLVDPAQDKWQGMRLEATNRQTQHRTRITFADFAFQPAIAEDLFSTRYLERAP